MNEKRRMTDAKFADALKKVPRLFARSNLKPPLNPCQVCGCPAQLWKNNVARIGNRVIDSEYRFIIQCGNARCVAPQSVNADYIEEAALLWNWLLPAGKPKEFERLFNEIRAKQAKEEQPDIDAHFARMGATEGELRT